MKFDYCIGNPPYQDTTIGDNETFAPPVYDKFLDAAYQISDKVEMIHPARFLFNAGSTPKQWNKKMLSDKHLKILHCESSSKNVFPNTDIKGGVAISYHDMSKDYGEIGTFTMYDELNSIGKKVKQHKGFISLKTIAVSAYAYRLADVLYKEHPELLSRPSKGHENDLKSNVFEYLSDIFFDEKPQDGDDYVQVLGRLNNERVYKWIKASYLPDTANFKKYKVFIAGANGSGAIGEVLSTPLIGTPLIGTTESFMSIGYFNNKEEAENALKYIKCKFNRVLLGILKVTQNITPDKYDYVPLQDFTSNSDINWNQSISDIDKQLYQKYGLSQEEIDFIETHVKEMN